MSFINKFFGIYSLINKPSVTQIYLLVFCAKVFLCIQSNEKRCKQNSCCKILLEYKGLKIKGTKIKVIKFKTLN